jgi:hypothetical protein
MAKNRVELTFSDEDFARLERERGLVPRAAWIKAQLFVEPERTLSPEFEAKLKAAWDSPEFERQFYAEGPPNAHTGTSSETGRPVRVEPAGPRYAPKRAVAPIPKGKGK